MIEEEKRVYYIENEHWNGNWMKIKEGIFMKLRSNGEVVVREPVDKYRPEHFHAIDVDNVRWFDPKMEDEIDFLNDMAERIHDRLDDIFCDLKKIKED